MYRRLIAPLTVALLTVLLAVPALASSTTVVVTEADVGATWSRADTRPGGAATLVAGPAALGVGSLELTTGGGAAKAQFLTGNHIGAALADVDALSYAAYRSSSSTNSAAQTISLNMVIDYNGPAAGGFTTLVFEPIYNLAQGPMQLDTWQTWDAFAGGGAIWWSTRAIPGVCAFTCYVPWSTIVANNPDATMGVLGFNIGSGWAGEYKGYADALALGLGGSGVTYDFEPYKVAQSEADCKNGGWQQVKRADGSAFKNQGDCIQYVNTGK